jgi:hypothetical protein
VRSPAAAIAWEFARRHRWGLIAIAAYMVVLAAIKLVIVGPGRGVEFHDAQSFALAVVVPIDATVIYFLAVFTFGLSGDIAARQSMYPARMFAMPVSSSALAGWPMLYGIAAMMLLWAGTRLFAIWPVDAHVPVLWPGLLAASLLAWSQALTWRAYALPGLRVIVTILWLTVIDAIVMVALELKVGEGWMLLILAPHVPLAYLAARSAVARARRGDVPDWGSAFAWLAKSGRQREGAFPSAARAQFWFEWRRYGRTLPAIVALVVPFQLSLLWVFPETPVIIFETLLGVVLAPALMATFVAPAVSETSRSFTATRPLTSAALIAAKLKVTIASTAAAWIIVVVAAPLAVRLSGTAPVTSDWMHTLVEMVGKPRAIAIVVLLFALLVLSTWKQLVQSLYIGLSGRTWAVKASVFVTLSVLAVALPVSDWVLTNRAAFAALWNALPEIMAVLACVKIAAAMWVAIRLHATGLVRDRTLLLAAMSWDVAVFALFALLVWILPAILVERSLLAWIAILAIPLARLSAAPLALDRSRHQ